MYVPKQFAIEDLGAAHEVMRQNSFATLVTNGASGLAATHLPILLDASRGEYGTLRAHVARANPQWRAFGASSEALAIFAGQHGYISPAWYEPGPAVPTWDYVAVHAYGRPCVIDEREAVHAFLRELTATYEAGAAAPWSVENQDPEYIEKLALAVVCFEIRIERIEAKAKLGQNRPADQRRVAEALDGLGAVELAGMIRAANGIQRA